MASRYRISGIALLIAGAELALISYFIITSVPLTAIGLSAALLGLTTVFLANSRPHYSDEAYKILLKTEEEKTATSLAELGINNKVIYLPEKGHFRTLIPFTVEDDVKKIKEGLTDSCVIKSESELEKMAIAIILSTCNKLIISLAVSFIAADLALAFIGQSDIAIYFIANAIAYFIVTLPFVNLNPGARLTLKPMNAMIFAGFLAIIAFRALDILSKP
jgi:hypothetical protein